ncbi:hypothetical protein [Sphingomonas yabuuchiae]|uniref:hypothetical protein n=1 Tax=Sphingomonas yabuuchiae TaxID=172044 RepID=UPI003D972B6B
MTTLRPAGVLGAVALLLTACQPGSGGPLVPVEGTGGAPVVKGGGPSATLRSGAVTVTLSGQWASEGEQTLDIRYTNLGTMVVRIDPRDIRLRRGVDPIDTLSVLDMTGVDLADTRSDKDTPGMLIGQDMPGSASPLVLPPGASHVLQANFANAGGGAADTSGVARVDAGQILTATIPMAGKTVTVSFRAESGGLF